MKHELLLSGFLLFSTAAGAANYDYSINMMDSEGNVQHMGDIRKEFGEPSGFSWF